MRIPHIWVLDPTSDPGTAIFKRYADASLMPLSRFAYPERGIEFDLAEIAALLQN